MRPPAVASPLRGEPVADEQYQGAQAEPPSIPEPVPASHESMRQPSPVIPEPPSDQEAAPSVRPRVTRLPGSAENARPVGPQQFRGREHQPAGSTPQTPVAPPSYPETLPAQSWERLPTRSDSFQLETAAEPECKPEAEETPFNAATRMSGLRNLIFSLGLKNMHQEEDERELAAEPPPPVEPVRQRQVHTQPYAPMPQVPPRRESESASPTLVTAPPEFLPPKPLEETAENEHRVNGKSTSRRDRRDTYDDVQILPSWRGQYKRKG
jgi:hypothetical protein